MIGREGKVTGEEAVDIFIEGWHRGQKMHKEACESFLEFRRDMIDCNGDPELQRQWFNKTLAAVQAKIDSLNRP